MTMLVVENKFTKNIVGLSFVTFATLLFINHFIGFFGHFGCDDMSYASIVHTVLEGKFTLGYDHAHYRWIPIFLTALSYKIFGINDQSSALMPLIFTLGIAGLIGRGIAERWQAALAILLFGLHSVVLYYYISQNEMRINFKSKCINFWS